VRAHNEDVTKAFKVENNNSLAPLTYMIVNKPGRKLEFGYYSVQNK